MYSTQGHSKRLYTPKATNSQNGFKDSILKSAIERGESSLKIPRSPTDIIPKSPFRETDKENVPPSSDQKSSVPRGHRRQNSVLFKEKSKEFDPTVLNLTPLKCDKSKCVPSPNLDEILEMSMIEVEECEENNSYYRILRSKPSQTTPKGSAYASTIEPRSSEIGLSLVSLEPEKELPTLFTANRVTAVHRKKPTANQETEADMLSNQSLYIYTEPFEVELLPETCSEIGSTDHDSCKVYCKACLKKVYTYIRFESPASLSL